MKKQMQELSVSTREGLIFITQSSDDDVECVSISPDQLDLLVQWLQEARNEALETKGS